MVGLTNREWVLYYDKYALVSQRCEGFFDIVVRESIIVGLDGELTDGYGGFRIHEHERDPSIVVEATVVVEGGGRVAGSGEEVDDSIG